MKDIIKVKVTTRKVDFGKYSVDALAVGVFSDAKGPDRFCASLDKRAGGAIRAVMGSGDFKAEIGAVDVIRCKAKDGGAARILLVGLGKKARIDADTVRKATAVAAKAAVPLKVRKLGVAIQKAYGKGGDLQAAGAAVAEGAYFGSYRYDEYITEGKDRRHKSLTVEIVDDSADTLKELSAGVKVGSIIGAAQSFGRTIANRPGNVINPPALAAEARKLAASHKSLTCTVYDKKRLIAAGMGGILAVGSGSSSEPRFILLKHKPTRSTKGKPTVAIVGKAITFDSGGISIKPSADMDQMKLDKSGGVAVLATMKAVAELNLPLDIWGLIPSAENMPGGWSYRPGDIVTTYSGKTVEVLNTDAEGRMVLCDAIAYAAKQKRDIIVDIATLTGAVMVALGQHMAGLMSNDDKLLKNLQDAAEQSGEKVWHLPSSDEYAEQMKSKIADLKNIGGRWGGSCTAAAFLRQFAGDARWAHLDIAGMDIFANGNKFTAEGSTGFGVRLLSTFLKNLSTD